jgi:uncharacterized protein DUF222/HNH endonuclease
MGESAAIPAGPPGLALIIAGLADLARAEVTAWPAGDLAECLRGLERAESLVVAARSRVLGAFERAGGPELDGHGGARSWLAWQTRVTKAAASGAVGWMRRLEQHPAVAEGLADEAVSASWARKLCDWSDKLPEDARGRADGILVEAAGGGVDLDGLSGLAEQIFKETAGPDVDGDDGFTSRGVSLALHFRGAGKLSGELTPECAAAVSAVLESLGKKTGPEDDRTAAQRHHDAVEEACRRLVASGGLPDVAGQPTMIQLHMTLDQLRSMPGAAEAEQAWAAGRAAEDGEPGWAQSSQAAGAYACDAVIAPIVTGRLDPAVLAGMTAEYLADRTAGQACPAGARCPHAAPPGGAGSRLLPDTLLRHAADLLSGPGGLAAYLRTRLLGGQFPAVSLPLDTGAPTKVIPPNLRRAVIARDRRCGFPGCRQPPRACQIHHLIPRARGGTTTLPNLKLLCAFHHLIAVHRWGWTLTAHADGTTTATSPDGTKIYRSHGPPTAAR